VGRVTAKKLRTRRIESVGQIARLAEAELIGLVGRATGRHLHALANNLDPRPVQPGRRRHSIGSQRALGRRARSPDEIDVILVGLVDRVCSRLRAARRVCRTVVLRLRFSDFSRATRSHTLTQATAQTQTILVTARRLLTSAMPLINNQGLTLVGVSLGNVHDDSAIQLALPFDRQRASAVDAALDQVRHKFGSSAITRAILLGRDEGLSVPLLPD
jgi:DNA polymerase-4